MLHSKLVSIRVGGTAKIFKKTETLNRLQCVIDNSVNGSVFAVTTHSPRRYQHILCAKPPTTTVQSSISNIDYVKYNSVLCKKTTTPSTYIDGSHPALPGLRLISSHAITKHVQLLSEKKRCAEKDPNTLRLKTELDKPLVILLKWLMAKPKHIKKYAELYIDHGYDVITVTVTPWQVMWPTKGTQLAAAEVVKFLANNITTKNPIILHGFSVGGYLWGECMVHMARDLDRYHHVLGMIQAQIWDSAVELSELTEGVPKAMFPKNETLQRALKNYLIYHMKTFHEPATSHYIRSSQMFHSTLVKKPALFLLSQSDPIGSVSANKVVKQSYESIGIRCEWKCWEKSPHVAHFQYYPDDYINVVYGFLQSVNMLQREQEAMRARI